MKYVYVIEKASDGSFSAFVPDLPGCTTSGDTVEEVKRGIKDAVAEHIESLREHNEPVPPPSSQADVVEAA
jgi:predicted RNase H-like HicB family nuclease